MKKIYLILFATLSLQYIAVAQNNSNSDTVIFEYNNPDIETLRKLSTTIRGELPIHINVEKIAETIRPANIVVEGEDPNKKMILARTIYQIEYPQRTIMLDSGMDYKTHRTFGKTKEPYFADRFKNVLQALDEADLIILTHYHADHVGGVVTSEKFEELAPKVWISELTTDLMIHNPHKKTTQISKNKVDLFRVVKDSQYMPIAPGVVVFMAPGHTVDSKMIYIKLANGKEFLHSVDSGWSMQNIREERMKNASWVSENQNQLLAQYKWLNNLKNINPNIVILCSHDNQQYVNYTQNKVLGNGLKIKQ